MPNPVEPVASPTRLKPSEEQVPLKSGCGPLLPAMIVFMNCGGVPSAYTPPPPR